MATKPIISYIRPANAPFPLDDNFPVVQNNGTRWTNKTALTNYIDTLWVSPTSDTYLYAKCGCSEDYAYALKADVPATTVICSCGRKIIEYSS